MQTLTTVLRRRMPRLLVAAAMTLTLAPASAPAQSADYDLPITSLSPQRHRAAVAELVDQERAKRSLRALRPSSQLRQSARAWAIVTRSHFGILSHGDFASRSRHFAFVTAGRPNSRFVGENIAFGSGLLSTPREIVRSWMSSSGHRANILRNWMYSAVWSSRSGDAVAVVLHLGRTDRRVMRTATADPP